MTIGQRRHSSFGMMLMICKGAALNTVFLAGDSEGLEAWRQLSRRRVDPFVFVASRPYV